MLRLERSWLIQGNIKISYNRTSVQWCRTEQVMAIQQPSWSFFLFNERCYKTFEKNKTKNVILENSHNARGDLQYLDRHIEYEMLNLHAINQLEKYEIKQDSRVWRGRARSCGGCLGSQAVLFRGRAKALTLNTLHGVGVNRILGLLR